MWQSVIQHSISHQHSLTRHHRKASMVACSMCSGKVDTGGAEVKGHSQLHEIQSQKMKQNPTTFLI